jgi:hypothetical protein
MSTVTAKFTVQGKNDFIERNPAYLTESSPKSEVSLGADFSRLQDGESPTLLSCKFMMLQGNDSEKFQLGKSYTVVIVGNDEDDVPRQ